jgi:hypothetical protein
VPDDAFEIEPTLKSTVKFTGLISSGTIRLPIFKVHLPMPPLGAKCLAIAKKGVYIMEECSGTLISVMCTHAGAGIMLGADVVPDERGYFQTYSPDPEDPDQDLTKPGLELYHAHPAVMGAWLLNGGFHHGLTMVFGAGHDSCPTVASVTWMPFVKRAAR